jgi:hypothetical protein
VEQAADEEADRGGAEADRQRPEPGAVQIPAAGRV